MPTSKHAYANSQKKMLWWLWDYRMATTTTVKQNFILKSLDYNIVTKAIIVRFHISEISYFTLARKGCVECQ